MYSGSLTKMRPSNSVGLSFCSVAYWLLGFALMFCQPLISHGQVFDSIVATCTDNGIMVTVETKFPFQGSIFAGSSFFNPNCRACFTRNATKTVTLYLPYTECGNTVLESDGDIYISNVIVMQSHCLLETESDTMHSVSCKLPHNDSLENLGHFHESHPIHYVNGVVESWMDFMYKGQILGEDVPNSLWVGEDFTVAIHLKDGDIFDDFQVERCWVFDGETMAKSRYAVVIHDRQTCQKSKWISGFTYTKLNKKQAVSYSFLKAIKFPHTKDIHFTCTIQVCRSMCPNYCAMPPTRSNEYLSRQKRSTPDPTSVNHISKRTRLMKATIKALGIKLMEKNKELDESLKADVQFNRRNSKVNSVLVNNATEAYETTPEFETSTLPSTEDTTTEIWADIMFFNLTNNIVVHSSRDFMMKTENATSSASTDCVPASRYAIVAGLLGTITFCLILACIGLVLYIRKDKKVVSKDNFLLYNIF